MTDKKLTICFLGNASSIHTIKWARFFSEKGHNVHLISIDKPIGHDLKGVKIHIVNRLIPIQKKPWIFMNMPITILQAKKIIEEIKPDIMHAHYIVSYGLRAALSGFRPLIMTAWGSDILVAPKQNAFVRFLVKYALNKADLITCDAFHMKKAIVDLGISESKIKIINFGTDTDRFKPGEKNQKIIKELDLEKNKIIISLKWPDPLSDYGTLIRSASIVIKKHPEARFIILGPTSFPEHLEELKQLVKELNLNDKVRFLGDVINKEIPEYLRLSDIYVCTSLSDAGLASSTSEAMACGLPAIITDFGDNSRWVENEKNGFLFKLRDHESLAEKIIYLLDNPSLGKKFGEISRKIIEERNDYRKEMAKMESMYQELATSVGKRTYRLREYKICKQCIMDTSDPAIVFDANEICNHCKRYKEQSKYLYSKKEILTAVAKIKEDGKGKQYDCVLGMSGGVDSCTAAYTAKKYGLRPLAIHVDNGWNSEISQSNIERVLGQLGIDLYTHVIDWEEFKDLQQAFLLSSVSNIDYPYDHAILSLFFQMAEKMKVKYIISGANDKTEFIMPRDWGYNSWDQKHLRVKHQRFGKIKKLKTYPSISPLKLFKDSFIKGVRMFRILDYIDYNKKEAKAFLQKEFGWKDYGGKHCESIYSRFFIGYVLPNKFGFDRNRAWLSNLILAGEITREEAFKELDKGFYNSKQEMEADKEYVIKKLGFTNEEFDKIMALPIKDYRDYPNNAFLMHRYGSVVKVARKFLRKV